MLALPRRDLFSYACVACVLYFSHNASALDPATLPAVGYHPGGVSYWSAPYFSDALAGGAWIEYADGQWGNRISDWNNPQFNADGLPQYLNTGLNLRAITYSLHTDYGGSRPASWPVRHGPASGRVTIEWKGRADVRASGGGTFLAAESNGAETGMIADGRRVYLYPSNQYLQWITITELDASAPLTELRAWLSDPADPQNKSLGEPDSRGEIFHPLLLDRLADAPWGFIRFMDWNDTNASPMQDWSDRRRPSHVFKNGVMNPRAPSATSQGDRGTGVAFEHQVALCNAAEKDLWINVPHLATEDFIRRLARLIRYGSDGTDPYSSTQANPVWAPLDPGRRVYIEYSNEIWSSGHSFPQGNWAQEQADALGISKAQFNARRFCDVWRLFEEEFAGDDARLIRVAAVFTAADWYTTPFLQEIAAYGPTLSPAQEPDAVAVTTYFGNGIQDWAHEHAQLQAGGSDPWFYLDEQFDAGGGDMRPVTIDWDDAYWAGPDLEHHLDETFDEWERRLLSGDAREGAGPDAVGVGGGFEDWLVDLARTTFSEPKPIVAYEGGPSIYTDNLDGGDSRDDGITAFMEALNRRPRMAEVYRLHLNFALARGLSTHVGFVDCGSWGKYGQWGHLEYLDQPTSESVKYSFLLDWIDEAGALRSIFDKANEAPDFGTSHTLPIGLVDEEYAAEIVAVGGDGAREIELVADLLGEGLAFDPFPSDPDRVRVVGTPAEAGLSYLTLRVVDAAGDPAWRTFTIKTVGGPDTLVEVDFRGEDPARHLPWTTAFVTADGVGWSGIDLGAGALARDGDGAFVWAQNMPADEESATLELAVADEEYLTMTLTPPPGKTLDLRGDGNDGGGGDGSASRPGALVFTVRRVDYHAPRRYAVTTSLDGFTADATIFESSRYNGTMDQTYRAAFPDTAEYAEISEPVEIRIYGFQGQYGGHRTSLVELKIEGAIASPQGAVSMWGAY